VSSTIPGRGAGRALAAPELSELVGGVLGIAPGAISDDLCFQAVPEWDSLGHAELMVALEEALGTEIDERLAVELTTYAAIRAFALEREPPPAPRSEADPVRRGLQGVVMDSTTISRVDGDRNRLLYRGYPIDDLAERSSFEETAYLLLFGRLPAASELAEFEDSLRERRTPPAGALELAASLRGAAPADALRTVISALPSLAPGVATSAEAIRDEGVGLIACMPALIASHHAARRGRPAPVAGPEPAHGAYLHALLADDPPRAPHLIDRVLVLQAEHGASAATLAVRTAIGTGAGLTAAITAALAAFAGPNHGGAIARVPELVSAIGSPERVPDYVQGARERREPVPGFGHRVYRGADPRARWLRAAAEELCRTEEQWGELRLLDRLREEMLPLRRHGVDVNVDFYAGFVYRLLGIPGDLALCVFAAARAVGWVAHAAEQRANNVLIRPQLRFVGRDRAWTAIERRGPLRSAARRPPEPVAPEGSLLAGFLRSARAAPESPALAIDGAERTYAEVEEAARAWAAAVLGACGGRCERLAFLAERSEVAYVAPLAALFAGAAFVPLNPAFPAARTRAMITSARPDALLVDPNLLPRARDIVRGIDDPPRLVAQPAVGRVEEASAAAPGDLAYLLFTSGSSGTPKGVPIAHGNVTAFLERVVRRYALGPGDRFSQTFDQTFDLSIFDLFGAWSSGACVCALSRSDLLAPAAAVDRLGLTVWFSVPSLASILRGNGRLRPGSMPTLRWSLFCGEPLLEADAEAWQVAAPNSTVENLYGPTELTIACAAYRWERERSPERCGAGQVPIGHVFDGLDELLLDESGAPTADEVGELAVAGDQRFAGYWRDPASSARALVELEARDGGRRAFYRTGDRVRRLPGGGYAFVGRTDHQVKVRGHRVELGEVEAAMRRQPGVEEAAAIPLADGDGAIHGLAGAVTGTAIDPAALLEHLRSALPPYAVPRRIMRLESMPRNANGKLDRGRLRDELAGTGG
jgi:amino acid adenylation domain-containing protein